MRCDLNHLSNPLEAVKHVDFELLYSISKSEPLIIISTLTIIELLRRDWGLYFGIPKFEVTVSTDLFKIHNLISKFRNSPLIRRLKLVQLKGQVVFGVSALRVLWVSKFEKLIFKLQIKLEHSIWQIDSFRSLCFLWDQRFWERKTSEKSFHPKFEVQSRSSINQDSLWNRKKNNIQNDFATGKAC